MREALDSIGWDDLGAVVATFGQLIDLDPTCFTWSGWRDLNPRPLAPKASALPSCATPRCTGWCKAQPTRPPGSPFGHRSRPAEKLAAGTLGQLRYRGACGRSSMVEPQPSKLAMPVRSRSPAPRILAGRWLAFRRLWAFDIRLPSLRGPRVPHVVVTHGLLTAQDRRLDVG
jgi:hypothetical protein